MTTTCALDELVDPEPDEPLDDAPDELAAEKPPVRSRAKKSSAARR